MGRILRIIALIVASIPLVAAGQVVLGSRSTAPADLARHDVIVVLGSAQFDGVPQPVFAARLDHAAAVWDAIKAPIVTVGGKREGDRFTEAEAGRIYLRAQAVPGSDLVPVPTGRDTWTSLVAVTDMMAERGWDTAVIVTDAAHLARSRAMMASLGFTQVSVSAPTSGPGATLSTRYVIRETLALMGFWAGIDR